MAFNGHSRFANSLFNTHQPQAGVNVGGGNSGSMVLPFVSIPGVPLQELDTSCYVPWSTQDDPSEFRKPADVADCDEETDLLNLVSNIVDEAQFQDSRYSEGILPTHNPLCLPKTVRDELLQCFQTEAKTQHIPSFPPNDVPYGTFVKAQQQQQSVDKDVKQLIQLSEGLAANKPWLFNVAGRDSYSLCPKKVPPGLPVSIKGSTCSSQMKPSSMSAYTDSGTGQPGNVFLDRSDIFTPPREMNGPSFHPFYEDHNLQSIIETNGTKQYVPADMTQLVSSFQSFMACEPSSMCVEDFPNVHKLTRHHEDGAGEQWKITSAAVSTQSAAAALLIPKQLGRESGHREGSGGQRKQTSQRDLNFTAPPDFSPQNTEYFQPQPFCSPLNFQNPNRVRDNSSVGRNQHSKLQLQQSQTQKRIELQTPREKKRMHTSKFLGDVFSRRPQTNAGLREGGKQHVSPNPHLDLQGSRPSHRFNGEHVVVGAGNVQQLMPFTCPEYDARRSSKSISWNLSLRPTGPYGAGATGMDPGDMMSANESAAFNSSVSDIRTLRGDGTYYDLGSAVAPSALLSPEQTVIQFYFYLDECYEQLKCLVKERKKMDVIVVQTLLGRRTASVTNNDLPQTPPKPRRVGHLLEVQMREQEKVASLVDKLECLSRGHLHNKIHAALTSHHMAVCITQTRCRDDKMSKLQRQRPTVSEQRDTMLMAAALKELAAATRTLCTALCCVLHITLPRHVKPPCDHRGNDEATSERCSSLCEILFLGCD